MYQVLIYPLQKKLKVNLENTEKIYISFKQNYIFLRMFFLIFNSFDTEHEAFPFEFSYLFIYYE